MTIMKKIFQLCAVLAVMFAVTGCYNDFDAPKPAKVYTDEDFAGMKHILSLIHISEPTRRS